MRNPTKEKTMLRVLHFFTILGVVLDGLMVTYALIFLFETPYDYTDPNADEIFNSGWHRFSRMQGLGLGSELFILATALIIITIWMVCKLNTDD